MNHPTVVEKLREITTKVLAKGIAVGSFADTLETTRYFQELGVQFIAYSTDVGIFHEAIAQLVGMLRQND